MLSDTFFPSAPLQGYIKCYQLRHFIFSDGITLPFKPYAPRPEQTLTFYPRGHEMVEYVSAHRILKRPRSMVMGQYVERTNRHLGVNDFIVFIVEFHPGVLHRLTGIPFNALTNTFVDAEDVFSKEIKRVNERLNSTDNYKEMIEIVEKYLLGIIKTIKLNAHPIDKVTGLLIHHPENISLDLLANASCLCPRQFERKFKERMGISPKLFVRIARLHKASRIKYNHPQWDWLTIALLCGYHDYQHLAKDFKALAGVTPITYFEQDTKAPETFFGLPDSSMVE